MPFTLGGVGLALMLIAGLPIVAHSDDLGDEIVYEKRLRLPSRTDAFGDPRAVVADRVTGEIFVVDSRYHRIGIFDADGFFRYLVQGGDAWATPVDVAVDSEGYLLVLARRTPDLKPGDLQANGERGLLWLDFDGRPLAAVSLAPLPEDRRPPSYHSVALSDDDQRLFLLDDANNHLLMANREGEVLGAVNIADDADAEEAREVILGRVDVFGDRVLVPRGTLGDVYLYDLDGNLVQRVGRRGTAPCQTALPVAAAWAGNNRLVILDRQRMVFMIWDVAANRCLSEHSGIGAAPGYVYQPSDMTRDAAGRIYISQGYQGRVQVFGAAGVSAPKGPSDWSP